MTPTREEFQVVADWLGGRVKYLTDDGLPMAHFKGKPPFIWQPHLPGTDCFALMAAIGAATKVSQSECSCAAADVGWHYASHDGTTAGIEAALASAVWQCAVRVAMEKMR